VHRNISLLEFSSSAARDEAVKAGKVTGTTVGERFLLVAKIKNSLTPQATISYEPSLPKCLTITERGEINIDRSQKDLLIGGELAAYARPDKDDEYQWQINQASIDKAIARGWTSTAIIEGLARRAKQPLPPLIIKAIQAWGGKSGNTAPAALALADVTILRITDNDVADAIGGSKLMQNYLAERLGPKAFLVKPDMIAALKKMLGELGFNVGSELQTQAKVQKRRYEKKQ
jgi:hypothetical protein